MAISGGAAKQTVAASTAEIFLNGSEIKVKAYDIGGYHYFKLRDLAKEIGFGLTWDNSAKTLGITTANGYTGEE